MAGILEGSFVIPQAEHNRAGEILVTEVVLDGLFRSISLLVLHRRLRTFAIMLCSVVLILWGAVSMASLSCDNLGCWATSCVMVPGLVCRDVEV
jgi:hypothetical protein